MRVPFKDGEGNAVFVQLEHQAEAGFVFDIFKSDVAQPNDSLYAVVHFGGGLRGRPVQHRFGKDEFCGSPQNGGLVAARFAVEVRVDREKENAAVPEAVYASHALDVGDIIAQLRFPDKRRLVVAHEIVDRAPSRSVILLLRVIEIEVVSAENRRDLVVKIRFAVLEIVRHVAEVDVEFAFRRFNQDLFQLFQPVRTGKIVVIIVAVMHV